MKSSYLSIGSIAVIAFSAISTFSASHASAQCVMQDINIQSSINGSRKPSERTNNVNQGSNGGCQGNTVNSTSVQNQVGGNERAIQRRNSNQQINGSNDSPTGINLNPVKVKTSVQSDVFNSADDPNNPANRLRGR